ncbi:MULTISPECIES: hypothetical protein [Burkholderiaceae]|nr:MULTISPECIES: hypothetical protein [Burkholderiaceae]
MVDFAAREVRRLRVSNKAFATQSAAKVVGEARLKALAQGH